jgi:hypothetical protein
MPLHLGMDEQALRDQSRIWVSLAESWVIHRWRGLSPHLHLPNEVDRARILATRQGLEVDIDLVIT